MRNRTSNRKLQRAIPPPKQHPPPAARERATRLSPWSICSDYAWARSTWASSTPRVPLSKTRSALTIASAYGSSPSTRSPTPCQFPSWASSPTVMAARASTCCASCSSASARRCAASRRIWATSGFSSAHASSRRSAAAASCRSLRRNSAPHSPRKSAAWRSASWAWCTALPPSWARRWAARSSRCSGRRSGNSSST